jgi:hypothetical protein
VGGKPGPQKKHDFFFVNVEYHCQGCVS